MQVPVAAAALAPSSSHHHGHHHGADDWIIAVAISLTASTINTLGMLLQKRSHMDNEQLPQESRRSECRRWKWVLGFALYVSGQLSNGAALAYGDQSMLAALGAFSLVVNTLLSPCMLGEILSKRHVLCTLVIVAGVSVVVVFSSKKDTNYTLESLLDLFKRTAFLITTGALALVLIYEFITYGPCRGSADSGSPAASANALPEKTSRLNADTPLLEKASLQQPAPPQHDAKSMPPLHCAFISAVCSSFTTVLMKSVTMLVKSSFTLHVFEFAHLVPWVLLIGLIISAIGTVVFLNKGLNSEANALYIVPAYFVMILVFTTLMGAVFFGDLDHVSILNGLMMLLGMVITISGVYLLSQHDVQNDPLADLDGLVEDFAQEYSEEGVNYSTERRPSQLDLDSRSSRLIGAVRRASSVRFSLLPIAYAPPQDRRGARSQTFSAGGLGQHLSRISEGRESEDASSSSSRHSSFIASRQNHSQSEGFAPTMPLHFKPVSAPEPANSRRRYSVCIGPSLGIA